MIELNKREATFLTDSRASVRNEESDLLYLGEIFFFFIFRVSVNMKKTMTWTDKQNLHSPTSAR